MDSAATSARRGAAKGDRLSGGFVPVPVAFPAPQFGKTPSSGRALNDACRPVYPEPFRYDRDRPRTIERLPRRRGWQRAITRRRHRRLRRINRPDRTDPVTGYTPADSGLLPTPSVDRTDTTSRRPACNRGAGVGLMNRIEQMAVDDQALLSPDAVIVSLSGSWLRTIARWRRIDDALILHLFDITPRRRCAAPARRDRAAERRCES